MAVGEEVGGEEVGEEEGEDEEVGGTVKRVC